MAKISVDGIEYEVDPDNNLLQECLSQGLDLPYFCWHPCMGSVGACRQCAVKQYRNAEDKNGTIVMACMTPASDGSIISIKDHQATDFRSHVIESLMISHPHDCPVCEEGGECHLQDMTQMSGHNYRRYDFKKVTHRNQNLGPFIGHEMNRCIACYRCVRFYNDYAGGEDLAALGSHHHVYFGRHEEGTLENEFSGNLAEVCPTGVFTDKTFSAHYTRKWDLQTAPSVCAGCGVGCNTAPGERYGTVRRVVNRYHHDINGYFICDRGRFGYDANSSDQRIEVARFRHGQESQFNTLSALEAKRQLNAMIGGDVIGIGSPRASLESNIALRDRVGVQNFYAGFSDGQFNCLQEVTKSLRETGLVCPSIRDIEQSDCILLVDEDITNTSARLALAVRQASRSAATELAKEARIPLWQDAAVRELAQNTRSPLIILSPQGTRLDDVASELHLLRLTEQLHLLQAIAHVIDPQANDLDDYSEANSSLANNIAEQLCRAQRPCLVSGISAESPALVKACTNIGKALRAHHSKNAESPRPIGLCFAMPEANSMGLALLLESGGKSLGAALQRLAQGNVDAAIVMENDLSLRVSAVALEEALAGQTPLLVLDQQHNSFNAKAQLLLPTASVFEQHGTWVNYEGRAQSSYQVFRPSEGILPAYEYLSITDPVQQCLVSSELIIQELARSDSRFNSLTDLRPPRTGISASMKSPRQSHRYSGRTAMYAQAHVHEAQQEQDRASSLAFSMEGVMLQKDASLMASPWAPAWNSNQAISKFQEEVNGELKQGSKGVLLCSRQSNASPYERFDIDSEQKLACFAIAHLFGSDEISAQAPAIQARCVGPYVCMGQSLANALGIRQHGLVQLETATVRVQLPVIIRSKIAQNCIGIYCANEVDKYALLNGKVALQAVSEHESHIASSRAMFDLLLIKDALRGEA